MIKNFTNKDQAYELIKLGVPFESADCKLVARRVDMFGNPIAKSKLEYEIQVIQAGKYYKIPKNPSLGAYDELPCWSVGGLIHLLPKYIHDEGGLLGELTIGKDFVAYLYKYDDGHTDIEVLKSENTMIESLIEMIKALHDIYDIDFHKEFYENIENVMRIGQPKDLWFKYLKVGDMVRTNKNTIEVIRKKYEDSFMLGFDANGRNNLAPDGYFPIAIAGIEPATKE